ncbi:MAG: hypothetical protein QGH48_01815, partial [Candidatus Poseidoniia archaeon]|nr:hypothetical protein [Candidatus Poseidoniia archaeon]
FSNLNLSRKPTHLAFNILDFVQLRDLHLSITFWTFVLFLEHFIGQRAVSVVVFVHLLPLLLDYTKLCAVFV